jgi:pimeloyl-ACP methyl ester carboxylesterase
MVISVRDSALDQADAIGEDRVKGRVVLSMSCKKAILGVLAFMMRSDRETSRIRYRPRSRPPRHSTAEPQQCLRGSRARPAGRLLDRAREPRHAAHPRLAGRHRAGRRGTGLRCPVLIITGESTVWFHRRIDEALARELPNARATELPGGHASPLTSPDRFMDVLEEFLIQ